MLKIVNLLMTLIKNNLKDENGGSAKLSFQKLCGPYHMS